MRANVRLALPAAAACLVAGCGGGHPAAPAPARTAPVQRSAPADQGLGAGEGFDVVQRDGVALWSRRAGRGYRLILRRGSRPARPLAVAPARWPFDADLGTDAAGRTVAVYSRCGAVPVGPGEDGFDHRSGCQLYELDPATGRERRLTETHAAGRDEVRPAINRGILAFARLSGHGGDGRADIVLKRLGAGRPARLVETLTVHGAGAVLGVDYEDARLAYAVLLFDSPETPGVPQLRLKLPGRPPEAVATGGYGEENARVPSSPSFAGRHLLWAYTNRNPIQPRNGFVVRRDLLTGALSAAQAPGYLTAIAADAARPSRPLLVVSERDPTTEPDLAYGRQHLGVITRPAFGALPPVLGLRTSVGLDTPGPHANP